MVDISASITTNGMSNRKRAAGELFDERVADRRRRAARATTRPCCSTQPPGTLLPVGGLSHGHKGYGLALLVEALTAGLAGHGRADPAKAGARPCISAARPAGLRRQRRRSCGRWTIWPRSAAATRRSMRRSRCACPENAGCSGAPSSSIGACALHPSIAPSLQVAEQRYGLKLADAQR